MTELSRRTDTSLKEGRGADTWWSRNTGQNGDGSGLTLPENLTSIWPLFFERGTTVLSNFSPFGSELNEENVTV